jgi:pyruvate dehydrogenase E1 component
LSASWHGAERARERGDRQARSHVERLLSELPRDATIITVCDAYPETLSWIGSVCGHRVRALGPEHFGQSGTIHELYAHHGFDVNGILAAAEGLGGSTVRYRR